MALQIAHEKDGRYNDYSTKSTILFTCTTVLRKVILLGTTVCTVKGEMGVAKIFS